VSFTLRKEWENMFMVGCRPGEALLRLPVCLRGIELGRPIDVVLDLEGRRAIGLEVLCGDGATRYLPLAAARVREDEIAVGSSLLLLDESHLGFYRRRARTLGSLRGTTVERGMRALGPLTDVLLGPRGQLLGVVVDVRGKRRRVPFDEAVSIADRGSVTAA
jgi:hypothetical protein